LSTLTGASGAPGAFSRAGCEDRRPRSDAAMATTAYNTAMAATVTINQDAKFAVATITV
jgi:hypothetical protein